MDDQTLSLHALKIGFATANGLVTAVDGVDLHCKPGKTLALLGESGCGKSMTALSILQLLPPTASILPGSDITIGQENILQLPEVVLRTLRGRRIGMIFQEPMTSLNPVLTICEQISEVLRMHFKLSAPQAKARVIELLTQVGMPDPDARLKQFPHQLSGGMKQRVMIAMALAGEPDILVADEPTTALDVTIQAQILDLLADIQKKSNMAILLITHDLGVVRQVADEVAVMYAGHIVEQAPVDVLFDAPKHPYTQLLLKALPSADNRKNKLQVIEGMVPPLTTEFKACRFTERCPYAFDTCKTTPPTWVDGDEGSCVRCHLHHPDHSRDAAKQSAKAVTSQALPIKNIGAEILRVENLKIHFPIQKGIFKRTVGAVKAVDGINLTLHEGETIALVGESGCGKTTAGRGILQLINPSDGRVIYQESDLTVASKNDLQTYRSDLQIIFQDPYSSMNPRMMVGEIIAEGIYALKLMRKKADVEARVLELLTQVGLPKDSLYRYPHEFSGGQRQRICIARALAVDPKVIICDEPTSALDVSVQAQILNLLRDLQQQLGLSYIFISHDMSVVSYMADRIAVMYLGRIVEEGPATSVLSSPQHPYTQSLLSAVPRVDLKLEKQSSQLGGEQPSPINPPKGCHFHPRCAHVTDSCRQNYPKRKMLADDHSMTCIL